MKPQKIAACIRPGTRRCSSFRWPSTSRASFLRPCREVGRALDRPAGADEPGEEACAAGEEAAADEQQRGEAERARENGYAPRAFLSSALIAGTISCRSPITA